MDTLLLSRIQFGDTAAFHILWPLMSIGLALYMCGMEVMWLTTGREQYYRQARFWAKIFVLTFAIGVASGFPLAFQFGTNWAAFSAATGSFFGNILGFETTIAFTLETVSLGILIFGWHKVPRAVHLLANMGVLVGASISAFWIMVANSWMQSPQGVHLEKGIIAVDNYRAAILNSESLTSFAHMWVACVESTLFLIAGISAWVLLRVARLRAGSAIPVVETDTLRARHTFFLDAFKYCLVLMIIITPLQLVVGDLSGVLVARLQPEKLAAMELHWDTNAPGTGAPWSAVAVPRATSADGTGGNALALEVPNGLSIITTHSADGTVAGLNSFAVDDRPNTAQAVLTFYAFRLMMLIGVVLVALMLLGLWYWYRGKLALDAVLVRPNFLRLWVWAIPLGFIATEAGWMVREIGRQPWILYHLMRTSEGVSSNLSAPVTGVVIVAITLVYLALVSLFIYFTARIVRDGPDLSSRLP